MEAIEEVHEQKKNTYSDAHKKYYEANKEEIRRKYKETKPYNKHYEKNKERIKARVLQRYYENKAKKITTVVI